MKPLAFLSKKQGLGISFEKSPENFLVEEIMVDGTVLEAGKRIEREGEEGHFTHFVLQKKGWNTTQALEALADKLGVSKKRFSFAGVKDRQALTVQLCSAWNVEPEKLLSAKVKDLQILGAWKAREKVSMGQLGGNRFTIKLEKEPADSSKKIAGIYEELKEVFPNYFGPQRFGSLRFNSHEIGKKLLKGELKEAVLQYLTETSKSEPLEASEARKKLVEEKNFEKALSYYPKSLKYERTLLGHLARHPRDYAGALRKLPRPLLLLFIHAYQAFLFNEILSQKIREGAHLVLEEGEYYCPANALGFPEEEKKADKGFPVGKIIGYETKLNEREQKLLEEEGIRQEDFKVKAIPEISSKGTHRAHLAPLKDFSYKKSVLCFSLPPGSYATIALAEFLQKDKKKGLAIC